MISINIGKIFKLDYLMPVPILGLMTFTPYILLNLKGNFKPSLGIALSPLLSLLVILPWIRDLLLPTAKSLLTPLSPIETGWQTGRLTFYSTQFILCKIIYQRA